MTSVNKLILGDNLEILRGFESETIDLIYLDPPFFSNRNYEVIWGDEGEVRSFQDRWTGGIDQYIAWLKERVEQMYRILKPTGSIFLHCDWHAQSYIQVQILDKIFGLNNLKNIVVWKRAATVKGNFGQGKKSLDCNTDTIFYYSKNNQSLFIQPFKDYKEGYIEQFYKYQEPDGRKYRLISMIGPGGAAKGNPHYEFLGVTKYWRYSETKMKELYRQGLIIQTKPGTVPQRKQYLDEGKGVAVQNLWDDIFALSAASKETIGYPTQKPEALLQRIIEMASNEGDVVLDPFVGGGTTVAVADKLNRKWIGIDQSVQAVKVTELRLNKQRDLFSAPFIVQLPAGKIVPIAKKPTISVEINELLRDAKSVREIELIASGQSEAGIEFYSWDFEYNAEKGFRASVIIDKDGKQTAKLKAGLHNIAVKVVDNDGLESIEVVKLKMNGTVKRVE